MIRVSIRRAPEETALEHVPGLNKVCGLAEYPCEGTEWWLAWAKKEPIAYVGLQVSDLPAFAGLGWIPRTGVLPEWRGGGLQKRLTRQALLWARSRGLRGVVTYTVHNPASANSLIACGFRSYEPEGQWAAEKEAAYWRVLF